MNEIANDGSESGTSGLSRRQALKRIGAAGAIAWATPVLTSLRTPAFAASPGPNPECRGETCTTFTHCSSNCDCVCVDAHEAGGFCIPGSTPCDSLTPCEAGACPPGSVCTFDTCCEIPVCIPISLTGQCPPGECVTAAARTSTSGATVAGGTIAGR